MSLFYRVIRRSGFFVAALLLLINIFYPFFDLIPVAQAQFSNPNFNSNNSGWLTGAHNIPDGWILAPGNEATYGTKDFLVMQYEAKAWDTQNDEVVATGGTSNNWAGAD